MKDVGDKFGAGELILPFVLQSAEVMKKAVAHLEQYLEKIEGHTKGKVVLATVFGDVHDIGKNLVNTILTNNGYTVYDLGKQVPLNTIIDKAVEVNADAIGLSRAARRRPPSRCRSACRSCTSAVWVPGADRRRGDQPRLRPPHRLSRTRSRTTSTSRASSTARTPFEGLDTMDALVDEDARGRTRRADPRRGARSCARSRSSLDDRARRPPTPASAPPRAPTRRSPRRPSGACARSRSTSTRCIRTSTATSSSSSTGAAKASRARPGGSWSRETARRRASRPGSSGCGASRTTFIRGCDLATSPRPPTATS